MSYNAKLREASGNMDSESKLIAFLYDLMRDHITPGAVEKLLRANENPNASYTNGWLAQYAQYVAAELTGKNETLKIGSSELFKEAKLDFECRQLASTLDIEKERVRDLEAKIATTCLETTYRERADALQLLAVSKEIITELFTESQYHGSLASTSALACLNTLASNLLYSSMSEHSDNLETKLTYNKSSRTVTVNVVGLNPQGEKLCLLVKNEYQAKLIEYFPDEYKDIL